MSRLIDPDQPQRLARARELLRQGVTIRNINFELRAVFGKGLGHDSMKKLTQELRQERQTVQR